MKIAVGGMIASGKSTLVKALAKELNLPAMDEFSEDDDVFDTLLRWLYEGKKDVEMLLQIYFLHKHYMAQLEVGDDIIIDRHIIEHWLFAQANLKNTPKVLNMYNGLFHQYMNDVKHPDLYIILDMSWDSFVERIMKRGREQEVVNFSQNEEYFQYLMSSYVAKLTAQCAIYDIPYIVVDTSDMSEEDVLESCMSAIDIITTKEVTHAGDRH